MENKLHNLRHSLAHVMAEAVRQLFDGGVKFGIGPVIENGFYYDFQLPRPLTAQDLPKIEKRMRQLISQKLPYERKELSPAEAKQLFADQPFKLELIDDLVTKGTTVFDELEQGGQPEKKATITAYKTGKFIDLCRGGHVATTKDIVADGFKLTKTAGAYWRGSEKNPMLQRIYGVAFESKQGLETYLALQAEIEKRDHRRIGTELDLFSFHPVSPGAPFWHPAGMVIFRQLEQYWRSVHDHAGYQEVNTPILVKKELWEKSGHWQHYHENMFIVKDGDDTYSLKPMNCPEATIIYSAKLRSYRELPLRFSEIGRLHRNEISGALGGLFRVRQLTMDDAHIFCTPGQIETEITNLLKLVKTFYAIFKLPVYFTLSTMPDNHLGDRVVWERAEQALAHALKKNKITFATKEKDGAFYGPKIDIQISDALGRSWQVATIQLDFNLPERFALEYVDEHGKQQRPVMIHRAIYGSFERFIGILTEHYAGAFPIWLSPIQVAVIPVGKKHISYSKKLGRELSAAGIRVQVDDANETVGYKIRNAEKKKIPYMLVIGDKEMKSPKLHVRSRGKKSIAILAKQRFIQELQRTIERKK